MFLETAKGLESRVPYIMATPNLIPSPIYGAGDRTQGLKHAGPQACWTSGMLDMHVAELYTPSP